jgi:phosphoglycolate phosphatase
VSDTPSATLLCCGLVGTAVADTGLVERAFTEAIATQGIVPGTGDYARCMALVHKNRGQFTGDVMSALFPENEARAQAAKLAFDRSFTAAVERMGVEPAPGAPEVLAKLSASGLRICLTTDLSSRLLNAVLDAVGWWNRFDLKLSADDVARGCPAPDQLLFAMLRTGVGDVRETVVADGSADGILAARRAGAGMAVGVLTGPHSRERLSRAGATHLIESISGLLGLVNDGAAAVRDEPPELGDVDRPAC